MEHQYLTLDEIHAHLLEMLRLFDEICRAERLCYYLSGGTLLGAIRHKGFIPWDDDIDVMMPRPDYERLLTRIERRLPKRYRFDFVDRTPNYSRAWARIYDTWALNEDSGYERSRSFSLFIDIFPVDGLPTNETLSNLSFMRVRAWDILRKMSSRKKLYDNERLPALKTAIMAVTHLVSPRLYARGLNHAARLCSYEKAKYAGVMVTTHYGNRERMPAQVFRGCVRVPFEDGMYPAPIGWHTYLTGLYRNYMQLPPKEKQVADHNLKIYIEPQGEDA